MAEQPRTADLVRQAKMVLDFNWTGSYTQPGPRLYPHQWSWDSALIALGYARYATGRAVAELTHLLDSQWRNGLLPQIVFNPAFTDYMPGAAFWHAERSPDAPRDRRTSGVVQPPVHATAALQVVRAARDAEQARRFLAGAFPRLAAWHAYLYRERDPDGTGLVYIRHPWESGMDDAPTWDAIFQRLQLRDGDVPAYQRADTHTVSAADRPTSAAYDRFAYLVRLFADRSYDEARIRADCPFRVHDVLFNTLLCRSGRDLAELARLLGEDPEPFEAAATTTAAAIERELWDDEHGIYVDVDCVTGRQIHVYTAAGLTPLFAGVPDEARARRLVDTMRHAGFGLDDPGVFPLPSYDLRGYGFSPHQYWRGPVWLNLDWFVLRGLERYDLRREADRIRRTVVDLCRDAGFHEYFDPSTGQGHGSFLFSWSAALLLDLLLEPEQGP